MATSSLLKSLRVVVMLAIVFLGDFRQARGNSTGCAGTLDPSFAPAPGYPNVLVLQGNKVVMALRDALVRLNENGSLDQTFLVSVGNSIFPSVINTIVRTPEDKLIIGGDFGHVNATESGVVARLLPNGELDPSFRFPNPVGSLQVQTMALQPDGKIIVAGTLTFPQGTSRPYLARANIDGSIDRTFSPGSGPDADVYALAVSPNGTIFVGGEFKTFDGQFCNQLCRLKSSGELDNTFKPERSVPFVTGITLLEDDRILESWSGGGFSFDPNFPLSSIRSLVRLNANGSLDNSFPGLLEPVLSVALQSDGKYIVAASTLKRLFPTGAIDETFTHTLVGPRNIALDDQSRILVSGGNGVVNGIQRFGLSRLLNDNQDCIPIVTFETNQISLVETNAAIAIPIDRLGNFSTTTTVQVFITPIANLTLNKFTPVETNIVFAPGISNQIVLLPLTENSIIEPRTTFTLRLTNTEVDTVFGSYPTLQVSVSDSSSREIPGSVDPSFSPDNTDNSRAKGVPWNGKYYVTSYGANRLFRVLQDGSNDPSFSPPLFSVGVGLNAISAVSVQPDGKVLVAGDFNQVNLITRSNLARFNADGSLDLSFDAGDPFGNIHLDDIHAILGLADGSLLVGGRFFQFQNSSRYCLAHISNTGALLDDFQNDLFVSNVDWVSAIAPQHDGSVIVGGYSSSQDSRGLGSYLWRFTSDGNFDDSFHPVRNAMIFVQHIAVQNNGKIIAGGSGIKRFNPDGSLDPSFIVTEDGEVQSMNLDDNENVLATFSVDSNTRSNLVRLRGGEYSGPGVCEIDNHVSAIEDSGFAHVKIRRGWSSQGEARLHVKTLDATAHAGEHYFSIDSDVILADGEGEKEIQVPLIDNPATAEDLYFKVTLSAETPGLLIAPNSDTATVQIVDSEPGFILSKLPKGLKEGGNYEILVRRTGPYTGIASVEIATEGGTAVPNRDYQPIQRTLVFDSETNIIQKVSLWLPNDYVPENLKTLRVVLRNPLGGLSLLAPSTNVFEIEDDLDGFTFKSPAIAVQNQLIAVISVHPVLPEPHPYKAFSFSYKTEGGSALPGIEYVPQQGILTFDEYEYEPKDIVIPLLPNSIVGAPTTVQIRINSLDGEGYFTNDTAIIELQHPLFIKPAGSIDSRFNSSPFGDYFGAFAVSSNFLYAADGFFGVSRFNFEGKRDDSFPTALLPFRPQLLPIPSGGLYMYGYHGLIRVNGDGEWEPSFKPGIPDYLSIDLAALTSNERLLISGSNILTSRSIPYLLRLLTDGSIDRSFETVLFENATGRLSALACQPDGRILIAGSFDSIDGIPRKNFARLLPDGQLDMEFNPSPSVNSINRIFVLSDGRILASGSFMIGSDYFDVARFKADGSLDSSWRFSRPEFFTQSRSIEAVDEKGRAYLFAHNEGGLFVSLGLTRLTSDGDSDLAFFPPPNIRQIASIPGGLLVLQKFPYISGTISRLFIDPPAIVHTPELLPNNRIAHTFNFPANTPYILEQTADFQTWTELLSGTSTDGYVHFETNAPAGDQFYRVRSK